MQSKNNEQNSSRVIDNEKGLVGTMGGGGWVRRWRGIKGHNNSHS